MFVESVLVGGARNACLAISMIWQLARGRLMPVAPRNAGPSVAVQVLHLTKPQIVSRYRQAVGLDRGKPTARRLNPKSMQRCKVSVELRQHLKRRQLRDDGELTEFLTIDLVAAASLRILQ